MDACMDNYKSQMEDFQYDHANDVAIALTDDGTLVTVAVSPLAGPGVWRRVLAAFEAQGVEDRNKKMSAWNLGLIGAWDY